LGETSKSTSGWNSSLWYVRFEIDPSSVCDSSVFLLTIIGKSAKWRVELF
jgi:hypothetical protein